MPTLPNFPNLVIANKSHWLYFFFFTRTITNIVAPDCRIFGTQTVIWLQWNIITSRWQANIKILLISRHQNRISMKFCKQRTIPSKYWHPNMEQKCHYQSLTKKMWWYHGTVLASDAVVLSYAMVFIWHMHRKLFH